MNSTVKTTAYIAGMVLLFLILIAVLGIMSGILPVREQVAGPEGGEPPVTVVDSTPTPAPIPTPDSQFGDTVDVPEMVLDEEHQVYAVNVTYSRGGLVTPSGMTTVVKGGSITLTILPDEGYMVENVTVNGETVVTDGTLTLGDVQNNCSVYVSFLHIAEPTPPIGAVDTPAPDWNPFASPTPPVEPEPTPTVP